MSYIPEEPGEQRRRMWRAALMLCLYMAWGAALFALLVAAAT